MHMFQIEKLFHNYKIYKGEEEKAEEKTALSDLSLQIKKGQFVGILGANGSGKSTLALHLAALLEPTSGLVLVKGLDSSKAENILEIRKTAGIVFQNPDDQLVGITVEEDAAFGPENMGLEPALIDRRIREALASVGMEAKRFSYSHNLSGGEKEKVVLSGLLAMEPECIIFDEPTAMTDPRTSRDIGKVIRRLNKEKGITILYITHNVSEVEDADYLFIMESGRLAREGTPSEIFKDPATMERLGLALPGWIRLAGCLREKGLILPDSIPREEELLSCLTKQKGRETSSPYVTEGGGKESTMTSLIEEREETELSVPILESGEEKPWGRGKSEDSAKLLLDLEGVSFVYDNPGSQADVPALSDINLKIYSGECIGVIGGNGAGKSTLFSHLNGLFEPASGIIRFLGEDIWAEGYKRRELRRRVGLCFQNPEYQLFADRVIEDVAFGPRNMGDAIQPAMQKARRAMQVMGLGRDYEDLSPFMLSGGEQRRVALAGILAMEPDILVLDEPAAGLDEPGRKNLFSIIRNLIQEKKMTVIFSSHSMEDVAEIASRILVMDRGRILMDGKPSRIFSDRQALVNLGLDVTWACHFAMKMKDRMHCDLACGKKEESLPYRLESLADWCMWGRGRKSGIERGGL